MTTHTFDELNFGTHPVVGSSGERARLHFPNGYGVSVITGPMFYTSPSKPYELAVMKGDQLCYDTPITDDVLGWQTKEDIERLLNEVAALPQAQ